MISSRVNPGYFWVINDSGNEPCIYLIDNKAELIKTYWIEDANNFDWEDIAIFTNSVTNENIIYIADIGDNYAIRNHVKIYTIKEPDINVQKDSSIQVEETYFFKYEDGPRDAETILLDPQNSELFVISKREENVRIYQAPYSLSATDTMELKNVGSLPFHNITAGDITQDGSEVLLKNYNAIFYWSRDSDQSLFKTLQQPHEILQYTPEPQGESIAWDLNEKGYFTLSERNIPHEQVLYFYKRK